MILTLLEMKFKAFVLMTISFACLMVIINIKVNIYRKVLFISTRSSLRQHEPALFQFLDFHPDQCFVTSCHNKPEQQICRQMQIIHK